jgi:hypothetical protein
LIEANSSEPNAIVAGRSRRGIAVAFLSAVQAYTTNRTPKPIWKIRSVVFTASRTAMPVATMVPTRNRPSVLRSTRTD